MILLEERQQYLSTTGLTREKRAVTACQFCRMYKTKCDNVRPTYGFCVQHNTNCVYPDSAMNMGDEIRGEPVSRYQAMDRGDGTKETPQDNSRSIPSAWS
jgi:hypothetical protein